MAPENSGAGSRILGLTGPIGCGKTTVGDILTELGAVRIDADHVVHELMQPGTAVAAAITAEFGESVSLPDGAIDRAQLGRIVFGNEDALRRLEALTHPAVREVIRNRVSTGAAAGDGIVIDAIKLLQSELLALADAVWVVRCRRDVQMERLTRLRRITPQEAEQRIAAMPVFEHPRVTTVIDNSGSLEELRVRVREAWEAFLQQEQ